jgi:hypothetical protein
MASARRELHAGRLDAWGWRRADLRRRWRRCGRGGRRGGRRGRTGRRRNHRRTRRSLTPLARRGWPLGPVALDYLRPAPLRARAGLSASALGECQRAHVSSGRGRLGHRLCGLDRPAIARRGVAREDYHGGRCRDRASADGQPRTSTATRSSAISSPILFARSRVGSPCSPVLAELVAREARIEPTREVGEELVPRCDIGAHIPSPFERRTRDRQCPSDLRATEARQSRGAIRCSLYADEHARRSAVFTCADANRSPCARTC